MTGGRRALGSLLVVDPDWHDTLADVPPPAAGADTALLALSGPAVLATTLAHDALELRHRLDASLAEIEASPLPAYP